MGENGIAYLLDALLDRSHDRLCPMAKRRQALTQLIRERQAAVKLLAAATGCSIAEAEANVAKKRKAT